MSRKNNNTNKKSSSRPGGELAAIERMIIQNAKPKASNKKKGSVSNGNGPRRGVPLALSARQEVKKPVIKYGPNGAMHVTHREMVGPVNTLGNGFEQAFRLRINPSSRATFKWLSTIAPSWETYRFRKLRFRYIPRVSAQISGSVLMLPDYDAADTNTLTEERASQHVNAVEQVVWEELVCVLHPETMNRAFKSHFTCTDERFLGTSQDSKTLDAAQFFLFTDILLSLTVAGKLWVEYEVDLFTPQPPEFPLSLGGSGADKNSGLASSVANVFTSNATASFNSELTPILERLDSTQFPGFSLFKATRDWEGFITKEVEGTGLTNGTGSLLRNGLNAVAGAAGYDGVNTIAEITNATSTAAIRQIWTSLKQGDLLGSGPVNALTLTRMIMNLGGSSVI